MGTLRFGLEANNLNVLEAQSSTNIVSLNQLMKVLLCSCKTLTMFIFGFVVVSFFYEHLCMESPLLCCLIYIDALVRPLAESFSQHCILVYPCPLMFDHDEFQESL